MPSPGAAPSRGPTATVSMSQSDFSSAQDVLVTVTLSNPTSHTVRILKWYTPVYGVEEPLFSVTRDGQPVLYTGAIYKRPDATGQDYISLRAGQSVASVVSLGDYYDLSQTGEYAASYDVAAYNLFSPRRDTFRRPDKLASAPVDFKADGRATKRPTPPPPPPPGGNAFNACSAGQQTDLVAARTQATNYSTESKGYLQNHNSSTARYVDWFGVFTMTRYSTVTTHFVRIADAFQNAGINFDCKCKQPYYAYVYADQPYFIHLCKYFWLAPLAGTDSRGGTLIHEMSHFNVVASTEDFVYGQDGARDLASSNPDDAIMNADNHEYFAENNPPLP